MAFICNHKKFRSKSFNIIAKIQVLNVEYIRIEEEVEAE